jgi:hypothetical protein
MQESGELSAAREHAAIDASVLPGARRPAMLRSGNLQNDVLNCETQTGGA